MTSAGYSPVIAAAAARVAAAGAIVPRAGVIDAEIRAAHVAVGITRAILCRRRNGGLPLPTIEEMMREFLARHDARSGREAAGETASDTSSRCRCPPHPPGRHSRPVRRCPVRRRPASRPPDIGHRSRACGTASKTRRRPAPESRWCPTGRATQAQAQRCEDRRTGRVQLSAPEPTGDFPWEDRARAASARLSSERASENWPSSAYSSAWT